MKDLQSYLKNQSISKLVKRCRQHHTLSAAIRPALPPALHPYCQVICTTAQQFTIGGANASTVLQLKTCEATLQAYLRHHKLLGATQKLRFVICPSLQPQPHTMPPSNKLSKHAAKMIEQTSNSIGHPALKAALMQLANRQKS